MEYNKDLTDKLEQFLAQSPKMLNNLEGILEAARPSVTPEVQKEVDKTLDDLKSTNKTLFELVDKLNKMR